MAGILTVLVSVGLSMHAADMTSLLGSLRAPSRRSHQRCGLNRPKSSVLAFMNPSPASSESLTLV